MRADEPKKVAVIGASGIGKHHAKWWALEGAEVCAIVGTSDESVAETGNMLREMFGFSGRGYTNLRDMLKAESPDIVDVCTPPHLHYQHATTALQAGCDVLCEKPFVFDEELSAEDLLKQANGLVEQAKSNNCMLGLCTQFFVAGKLCREIREEHDHGPPLRAFRGHLASPARGRAPVPEEVWFDLAPHMVGALQAVVPEATILWDAAVVESGGYRTRVAFQATDSAGSQVNAEIITDRTVDQPSHVRHIDLNEWSFELEGENDEDGIFRARIVTPYGIFLRPDTMRLVIRDFLAGNPVVDGPTAVQNLDWTLRLGGF